MDMELVEFNDDMLEGLNTSLPLKEKLQHIHRYLQQHLSFLDRISVALYDPATDIVKTFVHSSMGNDPLSFHQALLSETPSLLEIRQRKQARIIHNLAIFADHNTPHSQQIVGNGYVSSYTVPMLQQDSFMGFLFFNSRQEHAFTEKSLHLLTMASHLLSLMIGNELRVYKTMLSAIRTTIDVARQRDFETGSHLERMAYYSRIIARKVAPLYGLDDTFVENIFILAPLHDIGKIGIPDYILQKPGRLTPEEFEVIKTHPTKGMEIINSICQNHGFEEMPHIQIAKNIALSHHEAIDGSGYPQGKMAEAIPLEARIIAVADIFDALTSERPYKKIWSNDEALELIRKLAGRVLDANCVEAFIQARDEFEAIQTQFRDMD